MQAINPSQSFINNPKGLLRHLQSVFKVLNAGIAEAQPTGTDKTGVYNKFSADNGNGVMLRIGANNSSEPIRWSSPGSPTVVNHGLGRQPIGFRIYDKDKTCDVFRTGTPTSNTISLTCTDPSANCTVYIL
jgi:hypothetical protein